VRIRQARLDRLGHELRGAWSAAGGCVLHLVLPLLAHTRNPARSAGTNVAEDHPLRRPLALARDKRRSSVPAIRCRHALGQRQPAAHPRRSARLRVDPLRPTRFTRRQASASRATEAMAPATARKVNGSAFGGRISGRIIGARVGVTSRRTRGRRVRGRSDRLPPRTACGRHRRTTTRSRPGRR